MKKIALIVLLLPFYALRADGVLDANFGGGSGYISLPEGFYARGMAVQDDGKIVIVGSSKLNAFEIVRYNSDGSLDLTFNGTGIGQTGPAGIPFSVVALPNGSLVAVGQDAFGNYFQLAKYTVTGTLDPSFGMSGVVVQPQGFAVDSMLETDGKIIAAGNDNAGNYLVVRYNSDGSIDTTFASGPLGFIEGIKIENNGKVVVVGTDNSGNMQLVRYNTDGTIDTSFGSSGIVTGPLGVATSLVIQPNGYYVISGYTLGATPNMLLARYDTTGTPDSGFGTSGVVMGPTGFLANGIALQSNGYIVVAGEGGSGIKTTRYDTTGTLDTSYGNVGVTMDPLGNLYDVGIQWNGYIITVGEDMFANNFQVARYTGSPALTSTAITSSTTAPVGVVDISGTAQNPSQIYLYLDGVQLASFYTDTGGANSWNFSTSITFQGLYSLRAVAIYKNGNSASAASDILRIY